MLNKSSMKKIEKKMFSLYKSLSNKMMRSGTINPTDCFLNFHHQVPFFRGFETALWPYRKTHNKPGNNSNCNSFLLLVAESHSLRKGDLWALRPHNVTCHPSHPGRPNKAFPCLSLAHILPHILMTFFLCGSGSPWGAQPPCSLPSWD